MNKLTIDQLIAKLEEAKKVIGGDKVVSFWRTPHGPIYYLESAPMLTSIAGKITGDEPPQISFEISESEEYSLTTLNN